mmetsp:Transcript_20097/g.36353  ORF Transcript_20097/g.36353 Transcript_20097/m.36353 type:complete len:105 (-) Transcript_20097:1163-1477(-)
MIERGVRRSITCNHSSLDGCPIRNSLVSVYGFARFLAKVVLDHLLNSWNAGGPSNEDDLVHLRLGYLGVAENTLYTIHGLAKEVRIQLLELGSGNGAGVVNSIQ